MNINEIYNNYLSKGYSDENAISKTCQDIILYKISSSNLDKNVTIKGGVVMMNISQDKRRTTQDLDIDFIRYSLDDIAIKTFIKKLNDKDIKIKITLPIKKLHHQDYDGKRVFIEISDNFGNNYSTKLDIGVHKDLDIPQDELCFDLGLGFNNVTLLANSKEQICVEKIKSLLKFGITSTRYKDIFDIYYLINVNSFDKKRFVKYLDKLILKDELIEENNIIEVKESLEYILNNNNLLAVLFGVSGLLFIVFMTNGIIILNKNKNNLTVLEKKYKKIMDNYNNIIEVENDNFDKNMITIDVKYFVDLIDAQQELHVPILCYTDKVTGRTWFYMVTDKLLYKYELNKSDEQI